MHRFSTSPIYTHRYKIIPIQMKPIYFLNSIDTETKPLFYSEHSESMDQPSVAHFLRHPPKKIILNISYINLSQYIYIYTSGKSSDPFVPRWKNRNRAKGLFRAAFPPIINPFASIIRGMFIWRWLINKTKQKASSTCLGLFVYII